MNSIKVLADQFGGRIVDVSENSVIVEMVAKTKRVEAFLSLLRPFGLLESARTGQLDLVLLCAFLLTGSVGLMVMPRTPIRSGEEAEEASEEGGVVDASLLPPG